MIERVYVDNYRTFTNFELRAGKSNLLLGLNGAGKSSFFDVLAAVVDLTVRRSSVGEAFPANSLTRWDTRTEQTVELDISGRGGTYTYSLLVRHDLQRGRVEIVSESVKKGEATLFRFENGRVQLYRNDGAEGVQFPLSGARSFLAEIDERMGTQELRWFLDYLADIWVLRIDPFAIENGSATESPLLRQDCSNFASWYRHLSQEKPEKLASLFSDLAEAIPGFLSLKLVGSGSRGRKRDLVAVFAASGAKYELEFDELSDGQRVLVVLYALLLDIEDEHRTLLLDEPENFVGLTAIQPWLARMLESLGSAGQIFLISHHPEVVNYLAADNPIVFGRGSGGATRILPTLFSRDEGLSASEQIVRGLFDEQ